MPKPFVDRNTGDTPEEQKHHRDILLDMFARQDAAGTAWASFDHPAYYLSEAQHEIASDALIEAGLIDPDWAWTDEDRPVLTDAGRTAHALAESSQ